MVEAHDLIPDALVTADLERGDGHNAFGPPDAAGEKRQQRHCKRPAHAPACDVRFSGGARRRDRRHRARPFHHWAAHRPAPVIRALMFHGLPALWCHFR